MYEAKVGDVFVESWGYDQTNVDCYEVVRVTAKSVALMKCRSEIVDGRVLPVPGDPIAWEQGGYCRVGTPNKHGEVLKRITRGWKGAAWLNMTDYSGASLWDGVSTSYDTLAAGQPGH